MKEVLISTKIKRDPKYLYSLTGENKIKRTERKHKSNQDIIGEIQDLDRDKGFIYYISTDNKGFLQISRAKIDRIRKAVKGLNWLEVVEDS